MTHLTAPPQVADTELVKLHFSLFVPNEAGLLSRTFGDDTGNSGSAAECAIDIQGDDYRILVFSEDDGSFITDDVNMVNVSREDTPVTSVYTMIGEIPAEKLEGLTSGFRVMIIANLKAFGNTYPDYFRLYSAIFDSGNSAYNTYANIFKNGIDFNFTMPNSNNSAAWMPSVEDKKLIPMFGFSDVLALPDPSQAAPWGDAIIDTEISMLRAIAKVEIVDNLSNNEINGLTLTKSNDKGRYIPDITANPDWNKDDTQIITPSLPQSVSSVSGLKFVEQEKSGENTVWVCYIPEMSLTGEGARPNFNITVGTIERSFPFDNYDDVGKVVSSDHLENVLRNHIYRYTISGSTTALEVKLEVLDWEQESEPDVHFDPPTIKEADEVDPENPYPYYIKWTTEKEDPDNPGAMIENGYVDDAENLRLLMNPSTDTYAECKFTLAAPLNARWIAQLIPLQGALDAFYLEDGYSSGTIDGETPAVVHIKNTREIVSDERNEARLVIMVEYPDKTQREAIVVDKKRQTSIGKNYTIVQQKTTIE